MRRFRSIYRTRGSRRTTRKWSSYRTSKWKKSNRLFRRFIRKAPLKPEWKHIETTGSYDINADSTQTYRITPSTISSGTGNNQRIGNSLKFIKADLRIYVQNNSSTSASLAPVVSAFYTRIIIWA